LLESHGYSIFRLSRSFTKLLLLNGRDTTRPLLHVPLNYLATVAKERAAGVFQVSGWKSLQSSAGNVQGMPAMADA
jgi:hypothetical protein